MTVQHIWDLIKVEYPELSETMAVALISSAQQAFVDETECMRTRTDLSLTTAVTYDLPTDFDKLTKIEIADADENEVLGMAYRIDPEERTLTIIDTSSVSATVLYSEITRITIEYVAKPWTLSSLIETPQMPERFHLALVYQVKMGLAPDMAKFQRAKMLYEPMRLAAKRYGNSRSDRNATTILQHM